MEKATLEFSNCKNVVDTLTTGRVISGELCQLVIHSELPNLKNSRFGFPNIDICTFKY